jgi:hypothetical protein
MARTGFLFAYQAIRGCLGEKNIQEGHIEKKGIRERNIRRLSPPADSISSC